MVPLVIDCHAHYLDASVIDAIRQGRWDSHLTYDTATKGFSFPGFATRPLPRGMDDLSERLRHMDSLGVDIQLLSTWVDMLGPDLPETVAATYHRAVNHGLAHAVEQHPDRFRVLASVPLPYGEAAAKELAFAVDELGAVGALIGTNVGGRPLDDPDFNPLWKKAEQLGVPIVLHPLSRAAMEQLKSYYLGNLLGNPFDTTVAASRLILGGVMDRFPELKIVLLHGGGYLPYAVGRLDHGYQVRPEAKGPAKPPSHYLSRFGYDHVVYDPEILAALVRRVGSDRIMLGSDYPFDMEPQNIISLAESVLGSGAGETMGRTAQAMFDRMDRGRSD